MLQPAIHRNRAAAPGPFLCRGWVDFHAGMKENSFTFESRVNHEPAVWSPVCTVGDDPTPADCNKSIIAKRAAGLSDRALPCLRILSRRLPSRDQTTAQAPTPNIYAMRKRHEHKHNRGGFRLHQEVLQIAYG